MADQLVTLRPNATSQMSGTLVGAATTAHAATSDELDTTYVELPTNSTKALILALADPVLASTSIIKSVRARMRCAVENSRTARFSTRFRIGTNLTASRSGQITGTAWREIAGTAESTSPTTGKAWTQAEVNALEFWVQHQDTDENDRFRLSSLFIDVTFNAPPTVAFVSPAAAEVVTVGKPTLSASYTDPEEDELERIWWKVFSEAQYSATGFNPETSTAHWNSGELFTIQTTRQVETPLANLTNYRAYVKVSDRGSSGRYTGWVSVDFSTNFPFPNPPIIAAVTDNVANHVQLTVTPNQSGTLATERIRVEASYDNGASYRALFQAEAIVVSGTTNVVLYDLETNSGVTPRYRARGSGTTSGIEVVSTWTNVTADPVSFNDWWFKDLYDRTKNMKLQVMNDPFTQTQEEEQAKYRPLNRSNPIIVRGVIRGQEFPLEVDFQSEAEYNKFLNLRKGQRPILLQRGWTKEQWYISLGPNLAMRLGNHFPTYRVVTIDCTEVDRPT